MNLYIFNNYINSASFVLKSLITKEDFSGMELSYECPITIVYVD